MSSGITFDKDISRPAEYFQFGLYHVVVPLSFLRSISLASLFTFLVAKDL